MGEPDGTTNISAAHHWSHLFMRMARWESLLRKTHLTAHLEFTKLKALGKIASALMRQKTGKQTTFKCLKHETWWWKRDGAVTMIRDGDWRHVRTEEWCPWRKPQMNFDWSENTPVTKTTVNQTATDNTQVTSADFLWGFSSEIILLKICGKT